MDTAIKMTAPELLKLNGSSLQLTDVGGLLRRIVDEKGYDIGSVVSLARQKSFGRMVRSLVVRMGGADIAGDAVLYNHFGERMPFLKPAPAVAYRGAHAQNERIDRALSGNAGFRPKGFFFGQGAASGLHTTDLDLSGAVISTSAATVPIAIIGYGASGILTAAALRLIGFTRIVIYEKMDRPLGLWAQPNVFNQSRNNPRDLTFLGKKLSSAPGSGEEVKKFLNEIAGESPTFTKAIINNVVTRSLDHAIGVSVAATPVKYPIVINAMGLGKPTPVSDPARMITNADSNTAGPRWQQTLDLAHVNGKRLVFIGLGNSTAEMIRQVHTHMDNGVDVDYRVLTHYPKDAVFNPDDYVADNHGKTFRIFRDVSVPNLVDFHGDLPEFRSDYFRALQFGKIIFGVHRWEIYDRSLVAWVRDGRKESEENIDRVDQVYTLTGYKHSRETLEAMGCTYDQQDNCPCYDYDGEFIANPKATNPDERLYKGYFGIGPVLDGPRNRNSVVIPGTLFRLGDLLFGVIMRAHEYMARKAT